MKTYHLPKHKTETVFDDIKNHETQVHKPKILMLYGSLRPQSYSRKLTLEAQKVLQSFGADVKVFDPQGLPVFDHESYEHPKVKELHELALWSEGMVWCSPEVHGNITSVFKKFTLLSISSISTISCRYRIMIVFLW